MSWGSNVWQVISSIATDEDMEERVIVLAKEFMEHYESSKAPKDWTNI